MLSASIDALYKNKQHNINLPSPPVHHTSQATNMTKEQLKYCTAIMRNLKKHRDAAPFLNPVDYDKLNVPDYPNVITQPMNLLKVDEKLNNMEYNTVDEFIADVRLIFSNCFKYNGPEASISVLCQNVESAFEKGLRQMPPSVSNGSTVTASSSVASSPASVASSGAGASDNDDTPTFASTKTESLPSASKHSSPKAGSDYYKAISEDIGRPKREIHCPSKDYPETYTMQKKRISNNDKPLMKFCQQTMKEMKKSKYRKIAFPFLQPVDPVALNIPDYPLIVKHPMDISTIEKKLQNEEYEDADAFVADVELMFNNCYLYNPPQLPIYSMAKELEKVFRDKWAQRPIMTNVEKEDDVKDTQTEQLLSTAAGKKPQKSRQTKSTKNTGTGTSAISADNTTDPRDVRLAELERQLVDITQQIEAIKAEKRAEAEARDTAAATAVESIASVNATASTLGKRRGRKPGSKNKLPSKRRKSSSNNAGIARRKRANDSDIEDDDFTFEEKKELSDAINELSGDDLNEVVAIIQASMPQLGESGEEEITLDIDSLDKQTLQRLSEFISTNVKPLKFSKKDLSSSESDDLGQHRSESSSSDSE